MSISLNSEDAPEPNLQYQVKHKPSVAAAVGNGLMTMDGNPVRSWAKRAGSAINRFILKQCAEVKAAKKLGAVSFRSKSNIHEVRTKQESDCEEYVYSISQFRAWYVN